MWANTIRAEIFTTLIGEAPNKIKSAKFLYWRWECGLQDAMHIAKILDAYLYTAPIYWHYIHRIAP
jgi:hypothetical protein